MTVRILHLADLHIGYVPGYLNESRRNQRSEELKAAFKRAVEHALEPRNAVRAVIIAGDLFDTYRPESGDTGLVMAQLERLSSSSIPVLVIPGTHDSIGYPDSIFRTQSFPPQVHVLAEPFRRPPLELVLDGERFRFYWFTYEPAEKRSLGDYLAALRQDTSTGPSEGGYRVLVAHASLRGSPAWEMRRKDLPVSLEDLLASGMHYVALGHYHNFWESGAGAAGAAKVVYPGTLEGKCFGENGPRYLVTAEFGSGQIKLEKIQFNKRVLDERTLSLDSRAIASEEELARSIASLGREDLLLRLKLTGSPEFAVRAEFLQEALAEKFFHVEIEDETSVLSSVSTEVIAQEKTIRGMFVRKLREAASSSSEKDRAVYELALKEGLSAFGGRK
jgi:DNA repair exonuclease SbcCD nuclease subunit